MEDEWSTLTTANSENETQFTPAAQKQVERAAAEVQKYRKLLSDVSALNSYYAKDHADGIWPCFHAAVASGLCGRVDDALAYFARCWLHREPEFDWEVVAYEDVQELSAKLEDLPAFRQIITERVRTTRELLKLRKLEQIDFDSNCPSGEPTPVDEINTASQASFFVGKPLEEILRKFGIN